ncbi:MAG: hypothetical protein GY866_17950 [Proteobacteria bacterium]|nr:hypothetical protein [Pseudomonadota bacterium]
MVILDGNKGTVLCRGFWAWLRGIGLVLVASVFFSSPLRAQFNGNFDIERHFLDLENFLDWKAYQMPISWRYEWYQAKNAMRASIGSISMYRFFNNIEIRLEKDIGEYFTVFYEQKEDSFYGTDPFYHQAEFRFGKGVYASVIGFPQHEKKYGNMGYALSYGKRREKDYIQISTLNQFTMYNEKNANTDKNSVSDKYIQIPVVNRLDMQAFFGHKLFVKLDYKRINKARFEIFEPKQIKEFHGTEYELTLDWHEDNTWILGVTTKGEREFRSHSPESAFTDLPDMEQDLLLKWTDIYYNMRIGADDVITVGILDGLFENEIESSFAEHRYDCRFTAVQAYGLWEHDRSDWFQWLFSLQAGPAKLFRDYPTIEETVDDQTLEMKAGIGLVLREEGHYRFFVNTTWDLDIFITRQWDGGNVQLQMYF